MSAKERAIAERGTEGGDLLPNLMLLGDGRVLGYVLLDREPFHTEVELVRAAAMAVSLTDAAQVIVVNDVYELLLGEADGDVAFDHVADLYRAGDKRVSEAIAVFSSDGEDHAWLARRPYHCEGNAVVWLDHDPDDPLTDGVRYAEGTMLGRAIQAGFQMRAQRPFPALGLPEVALATRLPVLTPAAVAATDAVRRFLATAAEPSAN